jgi:acyl-CoA thioesterase
MRSARLGDLLTAVAKEENHHKLPFCEVKVFNQDEALVCVMTGMAYRRSTPLMPSGI